MEFVINLPKISVGFKLAGVYRLSFDDGSFYIGCSVDLRDRANAWNALMKNHDNGQKKAIGANVLSKIRESLRVVMDIVEICAPDEAKDREAFYLNEYKIDPRMLSVAECQYKPVLQYTRDGHFIKRHDSISSAARYNNTTLWRIQEVVNGNRTAHRDMIYVYETNYSERRKEITKRRNAIGIPKKDKTTKVIQLDENGDQLVIHDSYAAAARSVGCDPVNIKRVISGYQKTAAGFKWSLGSIVEYA